MPTPPLGQHFLTSRSVIPLMLKAAEIQPRDTVLEVGPGKGILTEALVHSAARVIAVEKDQSLAEKLSLQFKEAIASGRLLLVLGDIRSIDLAGMGLASGAFKVVANIPYYITGEFLRSMLSGKIQPSCATLLVQREVAERIARSEKESILSLSVKAYGKPRYIKTVPRGSFSPPPKVDSAVLSIGEISRVFFTDIDEKAFFSLIKQAFAHKRKQVGGNLGAKWREALIKAGISSTARAEDLSLLDWKRLLSAQKRPDSKG